MPFPAEKCVLLQKSALSCRRMPFPAEKSTFLQKNTAFGGHTAENRRKSQEGFRAQESRTPDNFHKTKGAFQKEMVHNFSTNRSFPVTARLELLGFRLRIGAKETLKNGPDLPGSRLECQFAKMVHISGAKYAGGLAREGSRFSGFSAVLRNSSTYWTLR